MTGNRVHITPLPGPKIEPNHWEEMRACADTIAQTEINAERWSVRLPMFSALSVILAAGGSFAIRMGLGQDLRLVAMGYKVLSVSAVVLGIGVNRYLAAIEGQESASDRLQKKVKDRFGSKRGVPDHAHDQLKIQWLYERRLQECPWILKYMDAPADLKEQVEEGCRNVMLLRAARRWYRRGSRIAVGATGLCVVATVCSLYFKKGVAFAFSYGFGLTLVGLVITTALHCRYRAHRQMVRRGQELANHAVVHRREVLDAFPYALTRIKLILDYQRLHEFLELREATVPLLPDGFQGVPLNLRKLSIMGSRHTLRSLPSKIRSFSAGGYDPRGPESLSGLSRLEEVSLRHVSGCALDNLATLPGLHRLRIDELHSLDHRIFRHINKFTTDALPPPSLRRVGFDKLVLAHPTESCLDSVQMLRTIHSLTLKEDPGLPKARIESLFIQGDVTYLKVKNWRNSGRIRLSDFISLWKNHNITVGGKKLKQEELVGAVAPQRPTTLIISAL